ncbi:MAG: DUF362 domain-containing protein [Phycisphaerae bacterium]
MSDDKLTRRELLARGAGAVAAAGAAAAGGYLLHDPQGDAGLRKPSDTTLRLKNYFAAIDFPASSPRISVAAGSDQHLERMVRAAVDGLAPSMGMKRFISDGDVVLVKPNVGFDRAPHMGATTNPEVLRWVIRLCKEAGARKVIVADNPIEASQACFAKSKIGAVADSEGAKVMLPARVHFEDLIIRDRAPDPLKGEALGRWPIFYRPLAEVNKVIGVAPIKDHNLCSASMNMKNWYGLLGGRRNQFHQAIHNIVSDLGMMMSPTLVISDATRVMMKNGPTGGRISDVKPGGELGRPAVIASVDPVACDAWCYEHLLGRDPAKLAYLDLAAAKIAAQIAGGLKRFGERDWRTYQRQGKIVTANV